MSSSPTIWVSLLCLLFVSSNALSNPIVRRLLEEEHRASRRRSVAEVEVDSSSVNTLKTIRDSKQIDANSTLVSSEGVFKLGFFTPNGGSNWYLGIWYASIPLRTYVWVANRETPLKKTQISSAKLALTVGRLVLTDSVNFNVWMTDNMEKATRARLLKTGNLVLLSPQGNIVWQSFDFPSDTWLPGMNITRLQRITCWKTNSDPSLGLYDLRLQEPDYGEFNLVFNNSETYWSTGKWDENSFTNVPEMMVPYIYRFFFEHPFTPSASFMYIEVDRENNPMMPLTRFSLDPHGQLRQFTWSAQSGQWNMFWSQPTDQCHVYGLCGDFGFCTGGTMRPCECLDGFSPVDYSAWELGDFTGGCYRVSESVCEESDKFEEIGTVSFDVDRISEASFYGSQSLCEESCLKNCSCFGLNYDERSGFCKNLFGSLSNLRNFTSDSTQEDILYIRTATAGEGSKKKKKKRKWRVEFDIIVGLCGLVLLLGFMVILLLILWKRRSRKKEETSFPVTNLKVFSYKSLSAATHGFSEKLGHGGFGAVFHGLLSDSTQVAVKRLERPSGSGGEKEFRAEVCTIGNVQHVNLARLRGFCCENSHRLLVYDYMEKGPLNNYLGKDGGSLNWDMRFRVALGTARGIAYLHEECRDCIMHCDIKPENILLDNEFTAKVSDFGMAKLIGREFSRVLTTMRGTLGYVAPEWLSGVAITPKADVYSYGMTLLEIIGGRRNVETRASEGKNGEDKWFFPPWAARQIIEGNIELVIDNRLAGDYDPIEAKRVGLVAVWCIQDEESARPTMGTVVKMLEGTVEVTLPPSPQLLQALVSGDSFHGAGAVNSNKQDHSSGGTCSDDSNKVSCVSHESPATCL